jgi:hypothetical protein
MRFRYCSLLILTLLSVSLPAQASRWYPIETGRRWVYSGTFGSSAIVQAPESFAGSLVQPLQWDSGAREYLSQDESGRIFQHGVTHPDGHYFVFDPPMLRMDSELTLGHEWETVFDAILYTVGGVQVRRDQARSAFRVIAVGPITVPAGTFPAVEVLRTEDPGSVPSTTFRESYSEDVGLILRTNENGSSVLLRLIGYGTDGVPTEVSSWGALKLQFGN